MHALEKEKLPRLSLGEGRNMVTQLLVVNLTVFIFLFFTLVIYKMEQVGEPRFYQDIMTWLRLPGSLSLFLSRPWTLVTSLFTHMGVWLVFSNMVWLWCFGTFMQHLAGYQRILPLYLFGGICGNLFYLAAMQLIPGFHAQAANAHTMGAAGSIMALAIGVTTVAPRFRIFPLMAGGIALWVITLVFTGLAIGTLLSSSNGITQLPILAGGALAGWIYMQQWKKGNDWGAGFNRIVFKLTHVFHPAAQRVDPEDIKKNLQSDSPLPPYKRIGKVPEQRLNEILDKISENGITSLTDDERDTLLRASKPE
ncbi:rhomboid family intramembrane serine protease [Chitinophaga nivalis]|uniref:Rhomboid family intramembrane serine protease n=1 Tax=Chitinophaga nivalis TaxID=2991709 RepID=A0ABT3IWC3_9BACT|nr:rhomboid family intramembrane serine protease [Chitinophaga nivalis]MCW3462305.1 rhomboid family intramembrane serine protease [Chitinophaga nivalis]MCW3488004.1 rhomboid family intramembrane serine protease [Chitinophaga nivalis]